MRTFFAVSLLAVSLSHPPQSIAQPFSQVIVFGDSNVDAGYYKMLASPGGGMTFNGLWPTAVQHGAGAPTTSPGLVYPQYLAGYFGLTANPSNTMGGTNYATSGAKNVMTNGPVDGGFTAAIPTHNQISNYLAAHGGMADSQALYVIHSGDNDVAFAAGATGSGPFPTDPNGYVTEAAEDLGGDILILQNAGAQHIIVAGLAYDYPTNDANRRALKLLYTQTLFQNLTQIGVAYHPANTDSVRLAISANPSNYGFTSVGTATVACTQPSGVSTAWALLCSSDPSAPSTWTSATAPQTDLFADDQHLATAGQQLMARFFRNLVVPWAAVHDVNGDGKSDIVWRNTGGDIAIWEMNGAAVIASGALGNLPTSWSIAAVRDFDSDGKFDLLWRDTSGNTAIWFMNGTTVTSAVSLGNVPPIWKVAGTGDFNGDGFGDILWEDSSGNLAIWLLGGGRHIMLGGAVGSVPPATWSVVGIADFNGDGKSDILWRDVSGNTSIWFMNGAAIKSTASLGNVPTTWSVVGTGDFNNDGYSDILWEDTGGNVGVWLMKAAGILSTGGLGALPPSIWTLAAVGDFNGDGNSDLLWRDTSGDTAVWYMNGTAVSSTSAVGNIPATWTVQSANAD